MEILWIYFIIINIMTFVVYIGDKVLAILKKNRVTEKKLLLLSIFGGAIGGLCAMIIVRHKIRKISFVLINVVASSVYLILLLNYSNMI